MYFARMIRPNLLSKKRVQRRCRLEISKRVMQPSVRNVAGQEPFIEKALHGCFELRVDQSGSYGEDREKRITVS